MYNNRYGYCSSGLTYEIENDNEKYLFETIVDGYHYIGLMTYDERDELVHELYPKDDYKLITGSRNGSSRYDLFFNEHTFDTKIVASRRSLGCIGKDNEPVFAYDFVVDERTNNRYLAISHNIDRREIKLFDNVLGSVWVKPDEISSYFIVEHAYENFPSLKSNITKSNVDTLWGDRTAL